MNWVEWLIVKRFALITIIASLVVVITLGAILFNHHVTLEFLSKATDTLLKALGIVVGTLWSLNRYFTTRTDYPQLRVEAIIDSLPGTTFGTESLYGLLSYRLDVVNTGKVLLHIAGYRVQVFNVLLRKDQVLYEVLHEWTGTDGGPESASSDSIEPGSWAGVSSAIACPNDVRAVRVFLEVKLAEGGSWTWHRILSVAPTQNHIQPPAIDAKEKGPS
jgi:hypothetical protein